LTVHIVLHGQNIMLAYAVPLLARV
jgi:hypothetical protein